MRHRIGFSLESEGATFNMSNKLIVTLLIAVLAVVLLGIGFSAASKKRQSGESSADSAPLLQTERIIEPSVIPEKFSMQVPQGFTETGSDAIDKYYVFRDASIIVTGEKLVIKGEHVEHYAENMKAQYEKTADEFTLVKEEQIDVNGVQCRMMQFRYSIIAPDAKQVMECLTGVLIKNDQTYIITCKSHAETFPGYLDTFRNAIKSVVIADTPSETAPAAGSGTLTQAQTAEQTVAMTAAQP